MGDEESKEQTPTEDIEDRNMPTDDMPTDARRTGLNDSDISEQACLFVCYTSPAMCPFLHL